MKQLKFKLILLSIGLFIGLFLGEVISRIYFFKSAAFSYSKTNSFGIFDNSGLVQYSEINGLKYELLPNLDTKYKLVDFHTNSEGFRGENYKLKKNKRRVAVIGDSYTMGTGVSEEELYAKKTETLLSIDENKNAYEFLNFGVSGYGLDEYTMILEKKVLKYNPDLVIFGFCAPNDQKEKGRDFNLDAFIIKPKKNVFWDSYLKKLLKIKLNPYKNETVVYKNYQLEFVDQKFNVINNILTKKDVKGLVFYIDLAYNSKRVHQIKELAEKNSLLFLDVSIFFKDKNLTGYILNELDPHPNNKSNLIFAKKLKECIQQNEHYFFKK